MMNTLLRRHGSRLLGIPMLSALLLTSCETPMSTGQKSLAGAAAGAAAGGLITGRGRGALVGAGLGAIAGALIGKAQSDSRRDEYDGRRSYPYARPTREYGFVYSPYGRHAVIDVRGIPSGERVEDPSTGGIFLNP